MVERSSITPCELHELFTVEVTASGGRVSNVFQDGRRLFARSILPWSQEVARGDLIYGGVALRATPEEVWVHPYTFRKVCENGAIMAHALEATHVRVATIEHSQVLGQVRQAIRLCCDEEILAMATTEMRTAQQTGMDLALNLLSVMSHGPRGLGDPFMTEIVDRLLEGEDMSLYGLMNAVTSVARDTEDPEWRWRLEELGGGIPALPVHPPRRVAPEARDLVGCDHSTRESERACASLR
jgi:hypothetical protein